MQNATLESILDEYEKNNNAIKELLARNEKLTDTVKNLSANEIDKISVKRASNIFDLSTGYIYSLINLGKIKRYHQDNKVFVSKSEIEGLIL